MSVIRYAAACALALAPSVSPASAADVSPDQARAVESSVRAWLAGTLGPSAQIPPRIVQLTPAGDHYDVAIPLGNTPDAPNVTGTARQLGDTRWSIDNLRLPTPAHFTLNMPQPAQTGQTDAPASVAVGPVEYDITTAKQSGQILLDTSQATPTTMTSSVQGVEIHAKGASLDQTSHIDQASSTAVMTPVQNGRVDVTSDATVEGYHLASSASDPNLELGIGKLRVTTEATGVSQARAQQIVQTVTRLLAQAGAAGRTPGSPPPKLDDASAVALLEALAEIAGGISITEQFDTLALDYGDYNGTLGHGQIGLAARNEGGMLRAQMDLGAEGLALPNLPLGDMAGLIPTRVSFKPSLSGVATADLLQIARDTQGGREPPPADLQALFSHGGIKVGLESFSVDVAGSNIAGLGSLVFTGPNTFGGTAQIVATNLDALQQRITSIPEIAGQALPVFILAKGIGRTVGNQMVWDITYREGTVLVNGQDLSAMAGGGGGGGASRPPRH